MAIIDDDGRVFGRVNAFDAAVALVAVAIAALAVVGYLLLRVPTPPKVDKVVPETLTAGKGLRINVSGENLLPYLKVFVQRTNEPTQVMHDYRDSQSYDSYVLANAAQAALLIESPKLAEIRLPEALMTGTYDLIFHNETRIVGLRRAAFTIVPPPVDKKASADPEGVVRVSGAFTGLTREVAAELGAGTTVPHGAQTPWGEILSVKAPAPDTARLNLPETKVTVRMLNRWQVPAEIRVQCMITQFKCWLPGGVVVEPGANLAVDVKGGRVTYTVAEVMPDPPVRRTKAMVTVRFPTTLHIAALMKEQDLDISPGESRDDPARIVSIQRRGEVTGEVNEPLVDGNIRWQERLALLVCVVRVPMTYTETGWQYRSQAIRAGSPMYFSTDRYVVRGTIESVALAQPATESTR
jgi:hypothetical protein